MLRVLRGTNKTVEKESRYQGTTSKRGKGTFRFLERPLVRTLRYKEFFRI